MDINEEFTYLLAAEIQSLIPAMHNISLSDIDISPMPDGYRIYISGGAGKALIHSDEVISQCIDNATTNVCINRNIEMERKDD